MSHHDPHGVQEQPAQCLCAAGCGFYSNVGTGGLCSKCHREAQRSLESQPQQQKQQQQPDASSAAVPPCVPSPVAAPEAAAQGPSSSSAAVSLAATPQVATKKPSPTRCWTCNKKVGLTGFSCKCEEGAVFCSTHRYAEAHACAFDYKALAKQQLEAKNPLVQASKVDRI